MKVYLNSIDGIPDAITSMFMSKRTWTRELENEIRDIYSSVNTSNGELLYTNAQLSNMPDVDKYNDLMDKLLKWGTKHITMLRYIDFSITVEGLHRAGQDDLDSHTKRFENRIIRSSSRLSSFGYEISDYYKDKIIPTDVVLKSLDYDLPTEYYDSNGVKYVKAINGYIREDCKDDQDVKRGLYMLSIPSNFIFKVNLTEWAHVYKERNIHSNANPEVKQMTEMICDEIEKFQPKMNRVLFQTINN